MHELIVHSPLFDVLCKDATLLVVDNLLYFSSRKSFFGFIRRDTFQRKIVLVVEYFLKHTCARQYVSCLHF